MARQPLIVRVAERKGDYVLLRIEGELANRFWTELVLEHLKEHYVDDGVRRIRLDVSPVGFIDNFGVATLIALYKDSRERGKQFRLEGAQGQVAEKLETTGVLAMLEGEGSANSGGGSAA